MPPGRRRAHRSRLRARPGCRAPQLAVDRFKYSLVLLVAFGLMLAMQLGSSPLMTLPDALASTFNDYSFLLVLLALEVLRQVHFLLAERLRWYWSAWSRGSAWLRRPWMRLREPTRYRLGRLVFWGCVYLLAGLVLSRLLGGNVLTAPLLGLQWAWANLGQALQYAFLLVFAVLQFVAIFWFMSRGGVDYYLPDEVRTRFSDVWGQDHVVSQVREVVAFLDEPDEIEARGGYVPGGILLYGPPGTGKTLLAEAIAGETGLPYVFVDPGAFTNMFLGVGVLKVRALYRRLRKFSNRYGGVVVFFDEADVLGNRGVAAQVSSRQPCSAADPSLAWSLPWPRHEMVVPARGGDSSTLNALLAEMNGLSKPRGATNRIRRFLGMRSSPPPRYRILHVMATNMPDALDAALLRPGRLDRKFQVGYPSREGRLRTFQGYLAKVRHDLTEDQVALLATNMPGATGALIKDIVNESLIQAMRRDRDVVTWADVLRAKDLKTNGLPDNFTYVDRERHATAVHEACHAVAAYYLYRDLMRIDTVTIEPRGPIGGFVAPMPTEDRKFDWRSGLQARMQVSLASLAGERLFFDGDSSVGVSADLAAATMVALAVEGKFGMGGSLSAYDVLIEKLGRASGSTESQALQVSLAGRVEQHLASMYEQAAALVSGHVDEVLRVAHALEVFKTLDGEDVVAVLELRDGPLVRGSAYAAAGVAAQLLAYHERIRVAHRDGVRSDIDPPLLDLSVAGDGLSW